MDLVKRLKDLSIEEMIALRNAIDVGLRERIAAERKSLQEQMAMLEAVGSGSGAKRGVPKGTKAKPKFRSPDGETWAGRGALPRWLTAQIEKGRKIEDFAL